MTSDRRPARTSPRRTSGSLLAAQIAGTATGTSDAGNANSSGTNATWLGTVKPVPLSNSTRIATPSATMQPAAATSEKATRRRCRDEQRDGSDHVQAAETAARRPAHGG